MTEKELDALEAVVRVALKLIRKVREQALEIHMLEEHADKQHSRAKRAERRVSALEVAIDRIDAKVKQALERDE